MHFFRTSSGIALATLMVLAGEAAWCADASAAAASGPSPNLPVMIASAGGATASAGYEGQIEALRQTVLSAQVPGSITLLQVKVGDRVKAGQVLARIDARAAEQGVAASAAQVAAARANLAVAAADLDRKRQLYAKNFIAKAGLEQAEAVHQATLEQVNALTAQTAAAQAQTGFHVVRAPYDGIVSAVTVELGDMAMPGRPLITVHDPSALRVTAAVPAAVAGSAALQMKLEVPALGEAGRDIKPVRVQVLPTVDPQSMTREVRADLPAKLAGVVPGQFARLWLPGVSAAGDAAKGSVRVPAKAVVRRGEVTALYVLDANGQPLLRQVRLGRSVGGEVEVLSGVEAGERVVTDPQAAARLAASVPGK